MKATEQPTYPFLFAARTFAADTQSEKLVLYHLVSRLRDGTCFPKQDAIAYAEQLTTRAVQYGIAALKKKGVVTIEKQGRNNVYRLHLKAIEDHQQPPMPETPEPVEPPTAKNIFIGGRRVGHTNPSSPIDSEEHPNHGSPVSGIGETSDVNTRSQSTCKKTWKKTSKAKKTVSITFHNTVPDENLFSEGQELGPQAKPTEATQMPASTSETTPARPRLNKPRMTLDRAQKTLEAYEARGIDLNESVICIDCDSIGLIKDSHCMFTDGGTALPCGSTRLVSGPEWLNHISMQWDAYEKQRDADQKKLRSEAGVTPKDIVGRLDIPSMEKQQDIMKCRAKAETMSIDERRTFAKECYDSGKRYPMRKAWFLYATGMLDDDGEAEPPWVTQLFANLEVLEPRDGETK